MPRKKKQKLYCYVDESGLNAASRQFIIESAIKQAARKSVYKATVYVDGIDQKKSLELTNALRSHGVQLRRVRSARDESEPLIRLADMWAGCARSATLGNKQAKKLIAAAEKQKHLIVVTLKKPL